MTKTLGLLEKKNLIDIKIQEIRESGEEKQRFIAIITYSNNRMSLRHSTTLNISTINSR